MKLHAAALIGAIVVGIAGSAAAELQKADATSIRILQEQKRGFLPVPGKGIEPIFHAPPHRLIYLNNCKPNGCLIKSGAATDTEDSRTNTSVIVRSDGMLRAYTGSDAAWRAIVQCVRDTYAPFNIGITDIDPCNGVTDGTCQVGHWEAMAAGMPSDVGFPSGVAGVSPYSCGVIPNAITFNFLNINPSDVNDACWTIAQETAHAFGLAHEMLGADPMTYISQPAVKRFQNELACIGTQPNPSSPDGCCAPSQECQCGPRKQNSVEMLNGIFGPSTPTPPLVTIDSPGNGSEVSPGFRVKSTVNDENGVLRVELLIDNTMVAMSATPPYTLTAPASLAQGSHNVTVRATDTQGTPGTAAITVMVGDPCEEDDDCSGQGAGYVCVDGRCVEGPDFPGGLGTSCETTTCISGLCVNGDEGQLCTEQCNPANDGCPEGYRCAKDSTNPGQGFCYPGDTGCLGCSTDTGGPAPTLPIGIGVVVAALLARRRRKAA